ncbi:MAG: EAL domain-containing protein [Dermatophilus congolensis]|nr:EAL domain-containing protein [Dermatophilus congolensis]
MTYYQPFYNLNTGRMQGVEALARLRSTDGGPQTPAEFFAEAERTGTIRQIDAAILEEALAQTARWHRETGHSDLILSVNMSAQTVRDRLFVPVIVATVGRHNVPGDRLLFDLPTTTFRAMLDEGGDAFAGVTALQKREITFCLDGFTAADIDLLPRAVDISVDIVKLHPSLASGDDAALVEAIQAVQDAGLPVVAAGIETAEQLARVRELGCEWAQGFYLGAPVVAADALENLATISGR